MRRGVSLAVRVALVAVLAAALPAHAAPPARRGIPRSPEFVQSVNDAIARGLQWLREQGGPCGVQKNDYKDFAAGLPAFVAYTMRACGVARNDPQVASGLELLRNTWKSQSRADHQTYVVALMCMAAAEEDPKETAGTSDRAAGPLSEDDLEWLRQMVRWLESVQNGGGWGYGVDGGGYDLSNTQYALLGLRAAAARRGVVVRADTWSAALDLYLSTQEAEGSPVLRFVQAEPGVTTDARFVDRARGWCYRKGDPSYGSMTAGAVASLCICRSEMARHNRVPQNATEVEHAIRDGIAWLGEHFSATENPGPGRGPRWATVHYYLYGLERAGILSDVDWMGEHDWYGEGAKELVTSQSPEGSWTSNRGATDAVLATCCALLFLKRGTHPIRSQQVVITSSSPEAEINFAVAANLSRTDFDDFLDLVLAKWHAADAPTRERIAGKTTAVGPRIVEPLVARLVSTDPKERAASFALLSRATGLTLDYDPAASGDALDAGAARWQSWLLRNEAKLVLDPAEGRIVSR